MSARRRVDITREQNECNRYIVLLSLFCCCWQSYGELSVVKPKEQQSHVEDERQGNAYQEFDMFRLVTKYLHAEQCSDAAACKSKKYERAFGYAPSSFLCLALIDVIENVRNDVC